MRPALSLNASQQLTLTPQLIQAIHLLQLSAADLEHEVEEALARNPFLERVEAGTEAGDGSPADSARQEEPSHQGSDGDTADAAPPDADDADEATAFDTRTGATDRPGDPERDLADLCPAQASLADHLFEQLAGMHVGAVDRRLLACVVAGLDDDGYLRQSADDLLRGGSAPPSAGPEDVEIAVRLVQSCDPAGVAARSLGECLALQLQRQVDTAPGHVRTLALAIAREHLQLLALNDVAQLARTLAADAESVRQAGLLIRSLNPRPGAAFAEPQARYVVADVIVRKSGGRWVAAINPQTLPNVRINRMYADAMERSRGAPGPLAQHLLEARRLVRGIEQRYETIQRVAQAVVDRQRLFFEHGELALRPLVLRDVARELGLHPSTICRVSSNKYAQTPFGVIELKRFFSTRASHGSPKCSATAVRALIRQILAAEDPNHPLSDVQIAALLADRGIAMARRTVAKYRALLRIPAVEFRRMSAAPDERQRDTPMRPIAALAAQLRAGGAHAVPVAPEA